VLLALAMACSAVLILWLNRETTFWVDEIAWYIESPGFSLEGAFEGNLGHLVLVSHVAYKGILELFGASYLPFRILAPATLILMVGVFFAYARRRVGGYVALAPSVVLLFFGSDMLHVLVGNAFTVLLAVACGLGAFLALDREDRRGDIWACGLLCLGVLTYSTALGFLAGAAVWILLSENRRARSWVFLVPIVLYGIWWLWSRTVAVGSGSGIDPVNLLVLPAWSFQSLSYALSALTGLSYQFPGGAPAPQVGPVLAAAALVLFALRLRRGPVPRSFWAAVGLVVSLWIFGSLTAGGIRFPENPRYLFPISIGVLLIGAESLRGVRWPREAFIALYLVAAAALGMNLLLLRDAGGSLREGYAPNVRAAYGALDIAGEASLPRPELVRPDGSLGLDLSVLGVPFEILKGRDDEPVRSYQEAAERYGSLGYSLEELRAAEDRLRVMADNVLVEALGLRLRPAPGAARLAGCARGRASEAVPVPRSGAIVVVRGAAPTVSMGRFGDGEEVPFGEVAPGVPMLLRVPADRAPDPWRVAAAGGAIIVCPIR
jgi:hypothetical protein